MNQPANSPFGARSQEEMLDVLMDPTASGPAIHYYMIRGGSEKQNITVMEAGTVGGEYIKTYGHYHVDDFVEVYRVLAGEGILVLQNRAKDASGKFLDDSITSFEAITLRAGESYTIPPYAGHLLVNTGKSWLVTSDNSPVNFGGDSASKPMHADYEPVKRMQGFAYYVVEQNGKPALVKNAKYLKAPAAAIK